MQRGQKILRGCKEAREAGRQNGRTAGKQEGGRQEGRSESEDQGAGRQEGNAHRKVGEIGAGRHRRANDKNTTRNKGSEGKSFSVSLELQLRYS